LALCTPLVSFANWFFRGGRFEIHYRLVWVYYYHCRDPQIGIPSIGWTALALRRHPELNGHSVDGWPAGSGLASLAA